MLAKTTVMALYLYGCERKNGNYSGPVATFAVERIKHIVALFLY